MDIRLLEKSDYYKNFINLLKQLTETNDISYEKFLDTFNNINNMNNVEIYVIEDTLNKQIVATGTLIILQKFIHDCGNVGYIEDLVVDEKYRNNGFGKKILDMFKNIAIQKNCYKIILNCSDKNEKYYEKIGFTKKNIQMAIYLQ